MHARNFPHDRQAQPATLDRLRRLTTIEALKHRVAFADVNPRSVVDHLQQRLPGFTCNAYGNHCPIAGITNCVIDQIADQFRQQIALPHHLDTHVLFEAEIDAASARDRRPVERHAARYLVQRHRGMLDGISAVRIEPRERQQLLHDAHRLLHRAIQPPQMHAVPPAADRGFFTAFDIAQRKLRLGLNDRKRRLQLMRGVVEKSPAR
ncbi:hypothetical protein KCU90_g2884, partial [Aureobasidium melanogenum]